MESKDKRPYSLGLLYCVGIGFALVGFLDSLGVIESFTPDWDETFRGIMFYGIFAPMGGLIVYEIIRHIKKHMKGAR